MSLPLAGEEAELQKEGLVETSLPGATLQVVGRCDAHGRPSLGDVHNAWSDDCSRADSFSSTRPCVASRIPAGQPSVEQTPSTPDNLQRAFSLRHGLKNN